MSLKNIKELRSWSLILVITANLMYGQMVKTTEYTYNTISGAIQEKREYDIPYNQKVETSIYAFENIPSMLQRNMLTQIFETETGINPNTSATNKTQSEWTYNSSKDIWQMTKVKKFYTSTSSIDEVVFTYDDNGNIISSADANNVISKYLYNYNNTKLNGIVKNTGISSVQPCFEDFNDGNIADSDPLLWTANASDYLLLEGRLKLNLNKEIAISNSISGSEGYNLEVLTKAADGSSGNATVKLISAGGYYSVTVDNNGTVTLKENGSTLASVNAGALNKWRRIKLSRSASGQVSVSIDGAKLIDNQNINLSSETVSLLAEGGDILFDNFRIYPGDATMVCYAYDPLTFAYTEKIDENSVSTYFQYDAMGRLNSISKLDNGDLKNISTFSIQYSSVNPVLYNPNSPASITTNAYASDTDQNPLKRIEFFDGLGRKIQEHVKNGTSKIITSSLTYDNLSREEKRYKSYSIPYSDNYDTGFETNSQSYYNTGEGVSLYSSVGNFPYSQNVYMTDPLNRIAKQGSPGTIWSIGSGNEKSFIYSIINGLYKESVTEQQSTDTYKDAFGRTVKSVQDPATLNLVTNYEYDNLDRLYRTTDPKGLLTSYYYNNLNQLTQKTTPDAGTTKYLYDKNGNLRFIKDANHDGAVANTFSLSSQSVTGVVSTLNQQFTLTMPAVVTLNAKLMNNNTAGQSITLKIKTNSITSAPIEIVAANSSLSDVTKKIKLPIGTYTYDVVTNGNSASTFNYTIDAANNIEFIYKKYDTLNRVVEEGEYYSGGITSFTQSNSEDVNFPSSGKYITATYKFDEKGSETLAANQKNLIGRISYSQSYGIDGTTPAFSNYYSYNDMGNVEWLLSKMSDGDYSKIYYTYDLQGRITKKNVTGGPTSATSVYKFYEYDQAGRLVDVYTSDTDNKSAGKHEAHYSYLADGSVKRIELGGNVQGVDYSYNPRGWLTQINNQNLSTTESGFAPDRFGMVIGYNEIDHIGSAQTVTPQFSGNISWLMYQIASASNNGPLVGWTYNYDGASRLTKADFGKWADNPQGWQNPAVYDLSPVSYDAAGNITQLKRFGSDGTSSETMNYTYYGGTNRLNTTKQVYKDSTQYTQIPTTSTSTPLYIVGEITLKPGFETVPGQTVYIGPKVSVDYIYDNNGNVIKDPSHDVEFALYNTNNLPVRICKTDGTIINYTYDTNGNRVYSEWDGANYPYYYFYGSDGQLELRKTFFGPVTVEYIHNIMGNDLIGTYDIVGAQKQHTYFLKDHLGSIKVRVDELGDVTAYDDYDPFGYTMDLRSSELGSQERLKFTGKERDIETGYDYFGARYYDARIGRWLQVDPLAEKYAGWSPYNYVLNNPLKNTDADGMDGGGHWEYNSDGTKIWVLDPIIVRAQRTNSNEMGLASAAMALGWKAAAIEPTIWGEVVMGVATGAYVTYQLFHEEEKGKNEEKVDDSKAKSKIWQGLKPYKGKTKTNGESGKKRRYYEWDHTHKNIEEYDRNGKHLGPIDPNSGKGVGYPVPGRKIDL